MGNTSSENLLITSSQKGNLLMVKVPLKDGADIHYNSDIALRGACSRGHLKVVQCLVEARADIHAKNEEALLLACHEGYLPVVQFLIEKGVDIHAQNEKALIWACSQGHLHIVKYLVGTGANIHVLDDVPYPVGVSDKYVYFLLDKGAKLPKSLFTNEQLLDAYYHYYTELQDTYPFQF